MRIPLNGIHLNVEETGSGRPLLFIHGFTGSARSWGPVFQDSDLKGFRKLAVDVIGHGDSDKPSDPERYSMERCVDDLVALLDALDLPEVTAVGYSMGARIALQLAVAAPLRVTALVLESGSPGLASANQREARIKGDEVLAELALKAGIEGFVDRWQSLPMWASQASLTQRSRDRLREQRLRNDTLGLANSLRGMGTGRQPSLWDRLPSITTPILLMAGALDTKYVEIAHQMAALLPNTQLRVIPQAGHTINLEQPDIYVKEIVDFARANAPAREAAAS